MDSLKRNILIVVVISLLAISLSLGYYYIGNSDKEDDSSATEYSGIARYSVEIQLEEKGNFTLYLPLAEEETGNVSDVMNKLHVIRGHCLFEVTKTKHGMALKISGNESVQLYGETTGVWQEGKHLRLSMLNGTNNNTLQYWSYLDNSSQATNIQVIIQLQTHYHEALYAYEINDRIREYGWQTLTGGFGIAQA